MFRKFIFLAAGFLVFALQPQGLDAARDDRLPPGGAELVVYEAKTSVYSHAFRETILPSLKAASEARGMPLRFVDVLATTQDSEGLAQPIAMVPTLVLFRDGREEGRISGLLGPGEYARLLVDLLRGLN